MRKMMLSIPLVMGLFVFTNAQIQDIAKTEAADEMSLTQILDEGYKEIKFEDMSADMQKIISTNYASFTVKKVEYNEDKKLTRVTLISKEDNNEKVVILNQEGKEESEE